MARTEFLALTFASFSAMGPLKLEPCNCCNARGSGVLGLEAVNGLVAEKNTVSGTVSSSAAPVSFDCVTCSSFSHNLSFT